MEAAKPVTGAQAGPTIAAPAAAPAAEPAKVDPPASPPSKDIGLWKFSPWRGVDHWVHPSGADTFSEKEAQRLRRLPANVRP